MCCWYEEQSGKEAFKHVTLANGLHHHETTYHIEWAVLMLPQCCQVRLLVASDNTVNTVCTPAVLTMESGSHTVVCMPYGGRPSPGCTVPGIGELQLSLMKKDRSLQVPVASLSMSSPEEEVPRSSDLFRPLQHASLGLKGHLQEQL